MGLEGIVSGRRQPMSAGRTHAWPKIKSYMVSELEVAAVLAERSKPTMALMVDPANNYLGGAFIASRKIKERAEALVETVKSVIRSSGAKEGLVYDPAALCVGHHALGP